VKVASEHMTQPLQITDLPGSERARRFEGKDHGATASFFVNTQAPGEGPSLHRHPYEEIFILLEGSARFRRGDDAVEARAGEIVIVPANTPHGFVNTGDERLLFVSIHPAPEMVQEDLE
jgi:quercetin dioxygenase-like cupin family protein